MTEILENLRELKLRIARNDEVTEEDVRQAINEDIKTFLNEKKTSLNTFIDSKYENFIIEYKKPTVSLGDSQKEQLISYLEDNGPYSWGILTNGKQLDIYTYSPEKKDFEKNEQLSGEINEYQFKYICAVLANKDELVLDENTINEHLGIENNRLIIREIYQVLCESKSQRTELLYNEWQKLFNLSEEHDTLDLEKRGNAVKFYEQLLNKKIDSIEKEYKALFAIQTYYAISLKLVLYKIIIDRTGEKISKPDFFEDFYRDIESNELYRKYNIVNLIDGDFFSWYLGEFNDYLYEYFYEKITDVTTIETEKINLLFIKFYENIFPFWVRHDMGEYYTPYYLARSVVDNTVKITNKKENEISILDPTCGSGIFLLYALERGIKNVYGIDINPLAVLTAKINYLINNFDISSELEIPVYLGDSTYFPRLVNLSGIECYEYELTTSIYDVDTIEFTFAKDFVDAPKFFEILDEIEIQVKNKNFDGAKNIIQSYDFTHYDVLQEQYDELLKILINLEERNLNSIWLKIIGNYLKCGSLRNMDCIVGNPPWVRWSNLPDAYKGLISKYCRIDGIFSDDTNSGGVDLNIAALIAYVSVRERLNNDGALGFIMPDSILFNKSFEGFRRTTLSDGRKYYLNKVIRWNDKTMKPFDPVTLDFAEYYFSFKNVEKIVVEEKKGNKEKVAIAKEDSFNNHYMVVDADEYKEIKDVLGHNDYKIRSGISLCKGGYYLLKFIGKVDEKTSKFEHYMNKDKRIVLSGEIVKLENEIVYPYVKSDDIKDNILKSVDTYCVFPYKYGQKVPYGLNELRKKYPKFYKYFMRPEIQKAIKSASKFNSRIQKNKFDIGIFRVGEYTYSEWFLATRDNTKSVFSICGKLSVPWGGKKMPLFDGHINYYSRDLNGNPLKKDEVEKMFKSFVRPGVKLYVKIRQILGLYLDVCIMI